MWVLQATVQCCYVSNQFLFGPMVSHNHYFMTCKVHALSSCNVLWVQQNELIEGITKWAGLYPRHTLRHCKFTVSKVSSLECTHCLVVHRTEGMAMCDCVGRKPLLVSGSVH